MARHSQNEKKKTGKISNGVIMQRRVICEIYKKLYTFFNYQVSLQLKTLSI